MSFESNQSLIDSKGRKYLTADERARFFRAAREAKHPQVQTFALLLAYTGCRISEALAVRMCDIDLDRALVRVRSLKRRTES